MRVKRKKEEFLSYLEDTANLVGKAEVLYLPESKKEVLEAVCICRDQKIPLTVSGGRTGTTGGCTPLEGAILSLEGLKGVTIDPERKTARIEAGVTLQELQNTAARYNLTLRASPTESLAFVSGAVSTNASGVRGYGWGAMRRYVTALQVILSTGEVVSIRRGAHFARGRRFDVECNGREFSFDLPSYSLPAVKSQAGYFVKDNMDLLDLFIGAEGTLGVIISCEVALQQIPFRIFDGLLFFSEEGQALAFVDTVQSLKEKDKLSPTSLEFFDGYSLDFLKPEHAFVPKAGAAVYFEQEADSEKEYQATLETWEGLIKKSGASLDTAILADTAKEREKVFSFRHRLPQLINEFLRKNAQMKTAGDSAVPWSHFEEMYVYYKKSGEESGMRFVNFGHVGEGHLHFNFLPTSSQEGDRAREYLKDLCKKAVSLGGTVSAEHGIGKIKKPYLQLMYSPREIRQMACLKNYFDPYCLLGLDTLFDKELLKIF